MSLTDHDILELNELCNAVVDESLTDAQKAQLTSWLRNSVDAREFYVRMASLSANLCHYAAEMQTGEPDSIALPKKDGRHWRWVIGLLSIAAMLAVVVWIDQRRHDQRATPTAAPIVETAANNIEYVASLTGSKQCQWVSNSVPVEPGARLQKGQRLELAKGFAEITFDSGAQVVLQGPASLDLNSAWSATLNRGTIKASLPPEAMGFSISNPTVEVVDLGTEFTMFTDASGAATDVLVLKGEVEAAPRTPADQQPIVLREKESRRFATSGVSSVHNSEQKLKELAQPVPLDHFVPPPGYAHWSFDEASGNLFKADVSGLGIDSLDAAVTTINKSPIDNAHAQGHLGGGLDFDGSLYARAVFPGISENAPHTVAFWVKVPKEAILSNAYAMVAWGVNSKELGIHPIHVGWNRAASDGTVGALRTDYRAGFAIGSTPLRDGRWHHVAVVLNPGKNASSPLEVTQYVDGRLEGEGKPSPPGSDIFMNPTERSDQMTNGTIWLGCRLGIRGVRTERFYGEMDELFIADRALVPEEIVRLMKSNQL